MGVYCASSTQDSAGFEEMVNDMPTGAMEKMKICEVAEIMVVCKQSDQLVFKPEGHLC
jgi:hypothetical protein